MSNQFIDLKLSRYNLDRYYIRTSIFNAIKKNLPTLKGDLLDIGCGKMPYKEYMLQNSEIANYVGLDIETALVYDEHVKPDYTWDGQVMPFDNEHFDSAFGTEVLEHCPEPEIILKEVHRVLKPNGVFLFTVPFLWNLHETPHDEYRYTPYSLERHLKNAGFTNIKIEATGGWHASMAQMLGLWIKRSPMGRQKRRILSFILKPIIKFLIKKDQKTDKSFKEGFMLTGLSGTATKG